MRGLRRTSRIQSEDPVTAYSQQFCLELLRRKLRARWVSTIRLLHPTQFRLALARATKMKGSVAGIRYSEIFQKAIDEHVQQIKGTFEDGLGGYCASGWLVKNGILGAERLDFTIRFLRERYGKAGARLNDEEGWTWETFRNAALEYEKECHYCVNPATDTFEGHPVCKNHTDWRIETPLPELKA